MRQVVEFDEEVDECAANKIEGGEDSGEFVLRPRSADDIGPCSAFARGKNVDLHAELIHLLQPGNDPSQAKRIASFSKI